MHYLNVYEREELLKRKPEIFVNTKSKVLSFINLCIHPYNFELLYDTLRTQDRITPGNYDAVKGVIAGLLVLSKRQHKESQISVDAYVIDFIKFIRADTKGDPVKFLLSMKAYMHRFLFIVGLYTAFGIDWREFVFDVLELKKKPQCKSFHTLFVNPYIRTLLHAYVVWKNYRTADDKEYKFGENDLLTLIENHSKLKTNLGREATQKLVEALTLSLPSWSYETRRKAAWAIDSAQDGFSMVNKQFTDLRYKQVQG